MPEGVNCLVCSWNVTIAFRVFVHAACCLSFRVFIMACASQDDMLRLHEAENLRQLPLAVVRSRPVSVGRLFLHPSDTRTRIRLYERWAETLL